MDYTSDSDVSDDTRELVKRGLASVRRKRTTTTLQPERVYEHFSVPNMDNYNIRHPLCQDGVKGATSTHGLNIVDKEVVNGQNHNIYTHTYILLSMTASLMYYLISPDKYIVPVCAQSSRNNSKLPMQSNTRSNGC